MKFLVVEGVGTVNFEQELLYRANDPFVDFALRSPGERAKLANRECGSRHREKAENLAKNVVAITQKNGDAAIEALNSRRQFLQIVIGLSAHQIGYRAEIERVALRDLRDTLHFGGRDIGLPRLKHRSHFPEAERPKIVEAVRDGEQKLA